MDSINKSDLVSLRDYTLEDKNFILATWLRGLYYGDSWFSAMKKDTFMQVYHQIVQQILEKEGIKIKIACLKEDPSVILGYVVHSSHAVHWLFVKKAWRNIGLASDLLPETVKIVTHLTKVGLIISKRKGFEFNPFNL
jgi:hypothetical protein